MKTKNKLAQKISITLIVLVLARLGIFVPIPGIDHDSFYSSVGENALVNFLNIFSGGGFSAIGIFALGIVPYINASIIMQLLTKIVPELENLQKEEGESGRRKITQITRYLTLLWAIIQSFAISLWIKPYVFNWNISFISDCIITLSTGSIIIMWFSELITEYGIGNGASLLIFQNIVSGIPKNIKNYTLELYDIEAISKIFLLFILFMSMLIITILVQEGTRKINIISARQLGKANELDPKSYIPLKLNQGGVMPIVFASAAMTLPSYLSQICKNKSITSILTLISPNGALYIPLYCIFIIIFSYFYASLVLNPKDIAKNLKKMGASIPSIRPGENTSIYLEKILNRLTFLGSMFLFIVALVPSIIANVTNITTFKGLGTTSLLILVGVAIDTAKQIQTYIISQQYDNMME
uniref:Protein translocase subunit SecY n=1 Tax=Ahnfeltia plicata TaxID=28023 RepID=A0A1C9CBA8_9FLOR|nr:preprotein translocase subunit SecY [Ahnfeltia plicata]AOM65673.1 preprotein translocase subunit SecY [Ahnfeltia plicata]UAT97343.1 preprotein translocase subunit SecY [Ahnfeltia plicata]